jgi:hypothetical protein
MERPDRRSIAFLEVDQRPRDSQSITQLNDSIQEVVGGAQ